METCCKVESRIGDKLALLDKDRDGVLSREELEQVVFHVLKRHGTTDEAQAVVNMLDANKDGKGGAPLTLGGCWTS
jgi:Ca2+-binding EF-hand superfamily protein